MIMRTIRLVAISLFSLVIFSASVFAQPAAPGKIVVINSYQFADEKAGITKLVAASKTLNTEFTPAQTELQTMSSKLKSISNEIQTARGNPASDPKVIQVKIDEGEKLSREIKFKQDDAKARFERRQQTLLAPVMQAIGKALNEYAKQKGYLLIFDIAKDENGLLVAVGDDKADVTKEFIAYYNAKP